MTKERENSKLNTSRNISAWLSRFAGRAGLLRLIVEILNRVFGWGVFSVPPCRKRRSEFGPSGIGPCHAKEHEQGKPEVRHGARRTAREARMLPGKINVTTLISRRLEQKRAFFAPFLTINPLDFSRVTEKMAKKLNQENQRPAVPGLKTQPLATGIGYVSFRAMTARSQISAGVPAAVTCTRSPRLW
jgi:hypothetical protein